jgi:hypothetical protein
MEDRANSSTQVFSVTSPVPGLIPQPHGGALRRGNPGNKGRPRSAITKEIVAAATPRTARLLVQAATKGLGPNGQRLRASDWLKAINAVLAHGGVSARTAEPDGGREPLVVTVVTGPPASDAGSAPETT